MARYFSEEVLILSSQKHGEADLMLNLFGNVRGIFRCVAPNALKSTHRFMGVLTSFAHVKMHFVWPKASMLPRVVAADAIENFYELWSRLDSYAFAKAMCEAVQKTLLEWEPMPKTFQLLLHHLRWLEQHPNPQGVFSSFILILLEHLGFSPILETCARCEKKFKQDESSLMVSNAGGLVCERCIKENEKFFSLSASARKALIDILFKKRGKKEALPTDKKVALQLVNGLVGFFEHHLQKTLFSIDLWNELKASEKVFPTASTQVFPKI